MDKPSLPKGTRDFGPAQMAKRTFIINHIRQVFQTYGFLPLETPAMENLETLTGKYGEEGDQLLFKILDSGDFLKGIERYVTEVKAEEKGAAEHFENILRELIDYCDKLGILELNDLSLEISKFRNGKVYRKNRIEILSFIFLTLEQDTITNLVLKSLKFPNGVNEEIKKSSESFVRFCNLLSVRNININKLSFLISEKGLRYDLTVPFARYVVMNRHEIALPFKRFQIQPVWRADRPQKGRYREFYQCDADVVGTDSLICEAEIILMIEDVFRQLGFENLGPDAYTIKVNHRGILSGLAELAGARENESALFVAIDKLDKIGEEKVKEELRGKGFDEQSLQTVFEILNFKGTTQQKIDLLNTRFAHSDKGKKGVADFAEVLQLLKGYGIADSHVEFDISLARGLSYYTGCIFEVKINRVAIGSVSGGGRYDNLTQAFGAKEKLSGVGISFGIDRLYDAMEELKLFPAEAQRSSKVLLCHLDEACRQHALGVVHQLRARGIAAEVYPDLSKVKKQLEYADKKAVPYALVIGPDEIASGKLALKNLQTGEQANMSLDDIISQLKA